MHLECHLLSLYRTAFDKHLITFTEDAGNRIQHDTGLPLKVVANQSRNKLEPDMQNGSKAIHDWSSLAHGWASADNLSFAAAPKATSKRVIVPYHLDAFYVASTYMVLYYLI